MIKWKHELCTNVIHFIVIPSIYQLVEHISFCVLKLFTMVLTLPCKNLHNLLWKKGLKGIDLDEQSFFYWVFSAYPGLQCCVLVCLVLVVVLDVTVSLKA